MAWETREGSGSLFKNSKRSSDSAPNAKGEARIGGVLYEVSAWTKKDKNGNPWQSLSFQEKEGETPKRKEVPLKDDPAFADSEIPF